MLLRDLTDLKYVDGKLTYFVFVVKGELVRIIEFGQ